MRPFAPRFTRIARTHGSRPAARTAAVLIATIFPWFRYLFWAFQGDYYRTISLFFVFGVITLAMTAFSRYAEDQSLNLWVLAGTIFLLLGALFFPLREVQAVINPGLRLAITIFLLSYTVLLVIGQLLKRQRTVAWTLDPWSPCVRKCCCRIVAANGRFRSATPFSKRKYQVANSGCR